jgi:hypothetical protein
MRPPVDRIELNTALDEAVLMNSLLDIGGIPGSSRNLRFNLSHNFSLRENIGAFEIYEADSSFLPLVTLRHAFHAAQLNAAATVAIPIPAKTAVARRVRRGLAQAFSRTCSGRMPIPTAYPIAR